MRKWIAQRGRYPHFLLHTPPRGAHFAGHRGTSSSESGGGRAREGSSNTSFMFMIRRNKRGDIVDEELTMQGQGRANTDQKAAPYIVKSTVWSR